MKGQDESKQAGAPDLSIVVAIIAGGSATMATCLAALYQSAAGHSFECIVPYDARLDEVQELRRHFSWARFVDARQEVDAGQFGDGCREHHDILRAIGLRQSRGNIVALLEDHGTPDQHWCNALLEAHRGSAAGVGGAVENGVDRLLNWAVYYCDFGRYQNPVPDGPVEFLSDSNVSYKRSALEGVQHLWRKSFHETSVNWELRRQGMTLRLDSRMVVRQTRVTLRLFPAIQERCVWGRSFAGTRAAEIPASRRALFGAFAFLLPFVLTLRIVAQALAKKRHLKELITALPLVFLLETVWSFGEFVGYLTGNPGAPQPARGFAPEHATEVNS